MAIQTATDVRVATLSARTLMPATPLAAAALVAGTFAAAALGGPWWATAVVASMLAAAYALTQPRRLFVVLVLTGAVALATVGHARFLAVEDAPPPALADLAGSHQVVAVARDDALVRGTTARLDLSVESVDGAPASDGLRLTLPATREAMRAGDRIAFTADIERPPEIEAFDYAAYLRSQGIHAVAAYPDNWELLDRDVGGWWRDGLRALRRWGVANIERVLPEPESSLAVGVLIGERRSLPAELTEDLRATGTSHLVVVSGQNVVMLTGAAIAILTVFVSRRRASVVALLLLPAYVVFVGAEPPVVRAALMAVGITMVGVTGRRTPGWICLLYAAAIMLGLDPLLAKNVSFQLSLSATAGVLFVAPPLRDSLLVRLRMTSSGIGAALIETAAVAMGAALAVLPVQVATFEEVSLVQVPANVLVAPLYEATLVVAILAAVLGWVSPIADVLDATARFVPALFIWVVGLLARTPGATVEVGGASVLTGLAWYALLVAALWWWRMREPPVIEPGSRTGLATTAALAVVAGGLWLVVLTPADHYASVTVLDVGQGQAVLVRDQGAAVLIDTGPPDGEVIAALGRVGQGRDIDAVVITHDDSDHSGGLPLLERRYDVEQVLVGRGSRVAGVQQLAAGDRIEVSDRVTIEVVSPSAEGFADDASDNNRSLVLLVTIGEQQVLLPADIEAPTERWLIASGIELRADALVAPHHGSRTSSTPAFLAVVQPRVAVISVGAGNPFGHPHPDVLARYEGITLLRTDEHGDVELRSDGQELWVEVGRLKEAAVH